MAFELIWGLKAVQSGLRRKFSPHLPSVVIEFRYMAKLYFRYGAMASAKTLNLLAVAHNYRMQGKRVVIVKPRLDSRFGSDSVRSRAGLEQPADIIADEETVFNLRAFGGASCVLVDESQFLTSGHVEQLRSIATDMNIPVICYGLRTNFKSELFEGSKRLLELCDSIEEVKSTCAFCNRKATMNLKHSNGRATIDGPALDLGADEKYSPACYACYRNELLKSEGMTPRLEAVGE